MLHCMNNQFDWSIPSKVLSPHIFQPEAGAHNPHAITRGSEACESCEACEPAQILRAKGQIVLKSTVVSMQ